MLLFGALAISAAVHFQVAQLETAILALIVCVISSQLAHIVGEYPSGDDYFMVRSGSQYFGSHWDTAFCGRVCQTQSARFLSNPPLFFLSFCFTLLGYSLTSRCTFYV